MLAVAFNDGWLAEGGRVSGRKSDEDGMRGPFWTFNFGHVLIMLGMLGSLAWQWNQDQVNRATDQQKIADHDRRIQTLEGEIVSDRDARRQWEISIADKLNEIQKSMSYMQGHLGIKPDQRGGWNDTGPQPLPPG